MHINNISKKANATLGFLKEGTVVKSYFAKRNIFTGKVA
jgi:hypothetical protein